MSLSRGLFAVPFTGYTIANADGIQDLFQFQAPSSDAFELVGFKLSQRSDFGDAEEEGLPINIIRGHLVTGSGGTVIIPTKLDPRDALSRVDCEFGNTTPASTGVERIIDAEVWNIRQTMLYLPIPELRAKGDSSAINEFIVVRLLVPPTTDIVAEGTAWIREL
jgi:hypothetical protein